MSTHIRSQNRSTGPIKVSFQARPACDRDSFCGYYVDIGHLRGTEVALTFATIAALEGSNKHTVRKLVEAGVLTEATPEGSGRHRYALFDLSRSLAEYYFDWVNRVSSPESHQEFEAYREVRRRCKVPADAPHSERILEAVFQKLLEIGNFGMHEVNGLLPLTPASWPEITAWLKVRIVSYAQENRRLRVFARRPYTRPCSVPVTWDMFKAGLPEAYATLPRTCLDENPRDRRDRPSRRIRERVWQFTRLMDPASLSAIIRAARARRPDDILPYLSAIARIEEILLAHKPIGSWTRADYADALERYAITKDILPQDSDRMRFKTVKRWRSILNKLRRYCSLHDPRGVLGIRRHLPPRFRISLTFKAKLAKAYAHLPQERIDDRKEDAHKAFAELDTIYDAARNRRDEMRLFGNRMREAEKAMSRGTAYKDFRVTVATLDARGVATGDQQIETFRLWRVEAAWRSLPVERVPHSRTVAAFKARLQDGFQDGFVVEHLHTRRVDGSPTQTSWLIGLAKLGTFVCPAYLPVDVRAARHDEIRSKGLPGFRGDGSGLLGFGSEGATIARSGLDHDRYFIPLEQSEIAMRIAFIALDVVSQAHVRTQEVQQLVRRDWKKKGVVPGKDHMRQKVWPKIERGEDLAPAEKIGVVITAELLDEMLDVCALHVSRCGLERFPIMPAADPLRWKCGPAEYIISWNGRALLAFEINLHLRYLLAGWPPFTLHDFRHAEAEEQEFDDVPEILIQIGLGHKSPRSTKTYTKLPAWAEAEKESRADNRKADKLERRRSARTGAGGNAKQLSEKRKADRADSRRASHDVSSGANHYE